MMAPIVAWPSQLFCWALTLSGAAEASMERVFTIPWFKHDRPDEIAKYANAIKKVVARAEELVEEVAEAAATAE